MGLLLVPAVNHLSSDLEINSETLRHRYQMEQSWLGRAEGQVKNPPLPALIEIVAHLRLAVGAIRHVAEAVIYPVGAILREGVVLAPGALHLHKAIQAEVAFRQI